MPPLLSCGTWLLRDTDVHELSRAQARRIAIRAQCLTADRPDDLPDVVRRLALLQLNPTNAVAPSADLVCWSRLGPTYAPSELVDGLARGSLVELRMMVRPAEDMALYTAEMAVWPGVGDVPEWQESLREWVAANDDCRRDILRRLELDGPLPSTELPDTCLVPWRSSGWNNDRNVTQLLGLMVQRGEVAVTGRRGQRPEWDLAERVYPDDEPVPLLEAFRIRAERRLRALGLARARTTSMPGEPNDVGEVGQPAVVEGVQGRWRVDPGWLAALDAPFEGRAALLSPLDRLVYDRKRMTELLEFDYQLEQYKPAAKRRWGYFALPILYDDRMVGKLDATADRRNGVLSVDTVHRDGGWTEDIDQAVDAEIASLARWLRLELAMPD